MGEKIYGKNMKADGGSYGPIHLLMRMLALEGIWAGNVNRMEGSGFVAGAYV